MGIVELDLEGAIRAANPKAQLLLDSSSGPAIGEGLRRLCERSGANEQFVEMNVALGPHEEVRLMVSASPYSKGYLGIFELNVLSRARSEVQALSNLLAAIVPSVGVRE